MASSFHCDRCGYETIDETLPDCPICGGTLVMEDGEEDMVPRIDGEMEDEENLWRLNI